MVRSLLDFANKEFDNCLTTEPDYSRYINLTDRLGRTGLHLACLYCDTDTIGNLIDGGADVSIEDLDGQTPLQYAVQNNNSMALDFFLTKYGLETCMHCLGSGESNINIFSRAVKSGAWKCLATLLFHA